MIPKKLHYCWFGKGKKPASFITCLESWKKHCPDFEIVEWNEANAPTKHQHFYKNALRKKKYAFAADSVRAKVLLTEGGIYLDTDMLLLKPLEELLSFDFFIGEEVPGRIAFGLFGAVPDHTFLKQMGSFYENTEFNPFSPPVITHTFSPNINHDTTGNNDRILAPEYFYPLPYENRNGEYKNFITEKSYAVHLWDHSWQSKKEETASQLLQNLATVVDDYLFHGYSRKYAKRYGREFSRKLYHLLFSCQYSIKIQEPRSESQELKILHLTTSSRGGAGIAALRLHDALREQGLASAYISKNLTVDFKGNKIKDSFFAYRKPNLPKKIYVKIQSVFFPSEAQKLQRKLTGLKDGLDYEMLSTAFSNFKMENHPLVKEADILHLHWVSGLIDFESFFTKCKKPIVWTLHDMNPFLGLFHYKEDELRNIATIGNIDKKQQHIKQQAIKKIDTGVLVAPSQWMLSEAKKSGLFSNFKFMECIPNSVDLEIFSPKDKIRHRKQKGFEKDAFILLYITDSKMGHRKGADLLKEALEHIDSTAILLVLGKGQVEVKNPNVKTLSLGFVNDPAEIASCYALADALLLPSREDNLPNVMLEAFACGTPAIGFNVGGMAEHIKEGSTGVLAQDFSPQSFRDAIEQFFKSRKLYDKSVIREYAMANFNYGDQALAYEVFYLKLYQNN